MTWKTAVFGLAFAASLWACGACGNANSQGVSNPALQPSPGAPFPVMPAGGQCPTSAIQTTPKPIHNVGTGSTGSVQVLLSAPANGATNYLCGWDVSAVGSATALDPVTIAGTLGGSITFQVPVALTPSAVNVQREYNACIPASAINTAISITTTADATGTAIDVDIHGCQF